jgi:CheY-like chemotaxis protein
MTHILVIDDDEMFRTMIVHMLSQDHCRVSSAGDGEEGLRLAMELKPDLIVTDILMPHKDGIEMMMALKEADNKIPIIAISGGRRAITDACNLQSTETMGVSAILSKPFARADLLNAIKTALKQ